MIDLVARLADVAEGQWGQITIEQAAHAGAEQAAVEELVAARIVEWVVPGVVRLRGGARPPFPRIYAAWLRLDPDRPAWERQPPECGVVSHGSAVRMYKAGDLPQRAPEFTIPGRPAPQSAAGSPTVVIYPNMLDEQDWRQLHGLPVTRPGRTLADIADAGSADLTDLARLTAAFLRGGYADKAELASGLERLQRRRGQDADGYAWLAALLEAAEPGV